MKNASPSILLSVASLLATFTALGAASPDAGSAATAAAASFGRASAGSALQSLENQAVRPDVQADDLIGGSPNQSNSGKTSGEKPVFEFNPSGKAAEEWAKLDKAQQADLNRLGTTLVDFAIERDRRIEKNRTETVSRLQDVRKPVEEKAHAEYNRARDARIRAGSELSALKNEREIAELHLAEAQKRLVEAEKGKADVTRRIEHADEYIRDIGRDIARTREEAESAGRDLLRARNDFQGRKDALAQAKTAADEAKKDRDAKKTAADAAAKRAEDAKTAAEAAEKDLAGKTAARDTAEGNLAETRKAEAAARRGEKAAAGALASAEGEVDRLAKRKAAADRSVQDAAASLDAAKAALEETRKKAAEPKGWFARHLVPGWFQPSVPRAERRLEAAKRGAEDAARAAKDAASAVAGQEQAVRDAKAALERAKKDLEAAGRSRAGAEDALAKAVGAFDGAKAAAESKAKDLKAAGADSARAKKALSLAEGSVVSADKAVASAETRRAEAEAAVGEAEKGLSEVRAKAGELEKAKGPAEQAAIIYKGPLADAEKAVIDARREREARQAAVDNLGERGAELNRKQAAYDDAKKAEDGHRPVWEKARRELDNVRAEAIRLVAEDERKARDSNAKLEDDLWASLERQLTDRNSSDAGRGAEKTGAAAGRASEEAENAAKAAEKAEAEAKAARKAADDFRRAGWKEAKAAAEKAGSDLAKAERAFLDAAKTVEKAKGKDDPEALSAANAALSAAKQAVSDAKAAQEAGSKAWADARDELASLERKAKESEDAVPAAKGRAKAAEAARREAAALDAANRKAVAAAADRAEESVAILRKAFDRQVDDAVNRRAPEEEAGIDVDRMGAREIQDAYRAFMRGSDYRSARDAYARARANLDGYAQETNRVAVWSGDTRGKALVADFRKAREAYAPFRERRAELEDRYNAFFSEAAFRTDDSLSDADADARHETEAARRDLYGYRVKGDRRWLARTSVVPAFADREENLLGVLLDEFSWQADRLAEAGEAKRSEGDPLRVELSAEQAAECAAAAALAVKRRAIYSGFYFFGADPSNEGDELSIWVDKGRFGPATVYFGSFDPDSGYFVPDQDESGVDVESGRMYDASDILGRFVSRNAPTNTLEGEAFNFIAFRRKFNELNANPDIRRADVKFEPAEGFDYGYDDTESEWGVEDVTVTNRMTRAIRTIVNVQENRRPAPIHGVLSIDNFNSMGDADRIAGEADTWMARLLLQRRLGLFSDEDSLALQGNVSLGGSLYGGAASYFVPRNEDARFWRGGDLADSLSWTFHGGYTDVDQGDVIPDLDVLGTGIYGGMQLSTRVYDSGRGTWDVSAGFTWRQVENSVRIAGERIDLGPNGDPYTLIPLSLALLYADKDLDSWRGRNYFTAELTYNLGGSAADELAAFRPAIDEDRYMILRAQFARLQLLPDDWWFRMAFLRFDGQYALDPVIGAEQFGLGGHGTVRGYVEREFMGDQGFSASLELRSPILLNPAWFEPRKQNPWKSDEQLQVVVFLDLGWYNLQDASPSGDDDNMLLGAGLGLRYSLEDWRLLGRGLNPVARLDWAYPVWQQNDIGDDAKSSAGVIHASLQFPF